MLILPRGVKKKYGVGSSLRRTRESSCLRYSSAAKHEIVLWQRTRYEQSSVGTSVELFYWAGILVWELSGLLTYPSIFGIDQNVNENATRGEDNY